MELEGKDKTERFIMAAKERARVALNQEYQKLTCLEKGMLEVVLNLCELKVKETDEDVKLGAKRVLVMLAQSESGRKRVDGDEKFRKRVKRAAPEALLAPEPSQ